MQSAPSNALAPLRGGFNATPSDIICTMLGTDRVVLHGFEPGPRHPDWLRTGTNFVSPQIEDENLLVEIRKRQQRLSWLRQGFFFISLLGGLVALLMLWVQLARSPSPSEMAWSVQDIDRHGVWIAFAKGKPDHVHFPSGSLLPNGERLLTTSPHKRLYYTDRTVVTLQPSPASPVKGQAQRHE